MLKTLDIRQFRNFEHARLELDAGLNLLVGENASGKTSLLEAAYFLFRGRSFRTGNWKQAVMHGQDGFRVQADVEGSHRTHQLLIKRTRREQLFTRDGERINKTSDILSFKPTLMVGPQAGDLISGAPELRRRWLDFSVFHVKHETRSVWRRYSRALNQRNAAIRKNARNDVLDVLDTQLAKIGESLSEARNTVLVSIAEDMPTNLVAHFGLEGFSIDLKTGWDESNDLYPALVQSRETDRGLGYTHIGPHRADLQLRHKGRVLRNQLSRGQQKMMGILLILSQVGVLKTSAALQPLMLMDDLSSELDGRAQEAIKDWLSESGVQSLVTTLPENAESWKTNANRMFHVKQGQCSELV